MTRKEWNRKRKKMRQIEKQYPFGTRMKRAVRRKAVKLLVRIVNAIYRQELKGELTIKIKKRA